MKCHTQHNDTQHNETQLNDNQHNESQLIDTQHNENQQYSKVLLSYVIQTDYRVC